jgi:PAS domain-containing protein/DNA-binding CsgD family transcriptional regulator
MAKPSIPSRSTDNHTSSVIESIYDAALDERRWPTTLNELTRLTDSQAASFWVWEAGKSQAFLSVNFDPAAVRDYVGRMATLDPTVRYLMSHPDQALVHDGLLGNLNDGHSREYFDWHDHNVETRFRIVAQCVIGPGIQAGIALHRTRAAGRYERADIERFGLLYRHLQRALLIGARIGTFEAQQQFSEEWLSGRNVGVVLLDRSARVTFVNRYAERLVQQEDGIRLTQGCLELTRERDNRELQALIGQALRGHAGTVMGGALRAPRPSGRRPYSLLIGPTSISPVALTLFRPAASVIITDPEHSVVAPAQLLQRLFHLTAAEARLAARLAAGQDLRGAAGELHITYGTARARLAQIFQKTQTRRQSELLRLLLTTLGAV